jgi:hypothetical protein
MVSEDSADDSQTFQETLVYSYLVQVHDNLEEKKVKSFKNLNNIKWKQLGRGKNMYLSGA